MDLGADPMKRIGNIITADLVIDRQVLELFMQ